MQPTLFISIENWFAIHLPSLSFFCYKTHTALQPSRVSEQILFVPNEATDVGPAQQALSSNG